MQPTFSVIIPAYNEERYLPGTLQAVQKAASLLGEPVEIIIGDNVSTDRTPAIAADFGARVVHVPIRCIGAVRNHAAATATGKYFVFQDADNHISIDLLVEIKKLMDTGRYVGGGLVNARYDRESRGLRFIHGLVKMTMSVTRVSMFCLYTTAACFQAIGGFNEKLLSTEDHDFALRLKKYGKAHGLRYANLRKGEIVMSSRKFDEYGDWMIFRRPKVFLQACFNNPAAAYELWYKPRREKSEQAR